MHLETIQSLPPGQAWVTVFAGSMSSVLATQAVVEGSGIPTYVPEEVIKNIDPFITGANPFGMELQVPSSLLGEARELLGMPPEAAGKEASGDSADSQLTPQEKHSARIEALGQKVRWCFVWPLAGWIAGAFLGFRYRREARLLPELPAGHAVTLRIWLLQAMLLIAALITGTVEWTHWT